jgi:hypothetical protein
MKEVESNQPIKTEQSVKQKKQIEHELIGSIVPHDGHIMWKINDETLEVTKAEYSNKNYIFGQENKREIIIMDGFSYVSALNVRNALKKYTNGSSGTKIIDKDPLKMNFF